MIPKLKTAAELVEILDHCRDETEIVFTNGCFDLIHTGHIRYLRAARAAGDLLVVGLNSDRSVQALKGPGRPLIPELERAEILAALEMVDYVVIFDEDTPRELIRILRPRVLVKGADYQKEQIAGVAEVEADGGRLLLIPLVPERSTTRLLQRIVAGDRSRVEI